MRRALFAVVSALTLMVMVGPAMAADIDDGLQAFRAGQFERAWRILEPLAERGDSTAQYVVGVMYDHGFVRDRNYAEAAVWFERAARQGNSKAAFNLGLLYWRGADAEAGSLAQDQTKAAQWLNQAADAGFAMAQQILAEMYLAGRGVAVDEAKACELARAAADRGLLGAQFTAGLLYGQGRGCPKNVVEAYKWFLLGADAGYPAARENVAILGRSMTENQIAEAESAARNWRAAR
ncbi:MAG: sel1 repeat family protein [Minwuiales bacterium]|nr:sel1 repeat family protein [Minwuiales bacterium]